MQNQNFLQEKKKQKTQTIVLSLALVITFFVIWQGFFKKEAGEEINQQSAITPRREIIVNFDILETPLLQKAADFSFIQPLETGTSTGAAIGRENPFLPY